MKKKLILLIGIFVAFASQSLAQNRMDRRFQAELNFSGVFLKTFGNALADSEVDQLTTNKWVIPGISFGYFLNKHFYIGYSFQPNRELILDEAWGFNPVQYDGNISVTHDTGTTHLIEGRYYPFNGGFYLKGALINVAEADYQMDFIRTGTTLTLGNNSYATDLDVRWNYKKVTTAALGLGYNWVFKKGLSLNLGLAIPMINEDGKYENIVFNSTNGTVLDAQDVNLATRRLEAETFFLPVQFNVKVGYNFNF